MQGGTHHYGGVLGEDATAPRFHQREEKRSMKIHERRPQPLIRAAAVSTAVLLGLTAGLTGTLTANADSPVSGQAITATDVEGRSVDFNDGWKFLKQNPAGAEATTFNDSDWATVSTPHDWAIQQDFVVAGNTLDALAGYLPGGTGWYRKSFTLPSGSTGERVTLDFDGVMSIATVWVNGTQVGLHRYGYSPFSFDITDQLTTDGSPNVVAIKVETPRFSSRWYSGSGIYRDVTLTVTAPVHIEKDGTFITTPTLEQDLASDVANVNVKTAVTSVEATDADVSLRTDVVDSQGKVVASAKSSTPGMAEGHTFEQIIPVKNPALWSPDSPNLYQVISTVIVDGVEVDHTTTRTGFKYSKFDEDGFHLNGERVELRGANLHHDLGSLGTAVNRRATERQLQLMKDAGINAIRTSHNPASRVFVDLAEEMGIMLYNEAFDNWDTIRFLPNEYSKYFASDAEGWLKSFVKRDRNSPAVIIWSIGNEVTFGANAVQTAENLIKWVKETDPTRPTTIGENKFSEVAYKISSMVDVPSRNYGTEEHYEQAANNSASKTVIGSEVSWSLQSRGYYYNPNEVIRGAFGGELQGSSYDNHIQSAATTSTHAVAIQRVRNSDVVVAGTFMWTGIDHLGEPLPYHQVPPAGATEAAKGAYTGIVDLAGFKKDIYYFYQSQWTSDPVLHLLPHWNWNEGDTVQVWAYTNADTVKLYLNDELVGERSFERKTDKHGDMYRETADGKLHLQWDVPFQPGTLRAEAIRDGEIIATDSVSTAAAAAQIRLTPDRSTISPDGEDLSFITADILDADGVFVPRATNQLTFNVTGGEIVSVDNGNPASLERFHGTNQRKAFSGKALVVVKSDGSGDPVRVTATADGLDSGEATVRTLDVDPVVATVCRGGMAHLEVSATHSEDTRVEISVETPYGDKTFQSVASGKKVTHPFNTKLHALPAGSVKVTATAVVEGEQINLVRTIPYEGTTCKK
jgi:beta-galactosidase